jgi:hypothetical protein
MDCRRKTSLFLGILSLALLCGCGSDEPSKPDVKTTAGEPSKQDVKTTAGEPSKQDPKTTAGGRSKQALQKMIESLPADTGAMGTNPVIRGAGPYATEEAVIAVLGRPDSAINTPGQEQNFRKTWRYNCSDGFLTVDIAHCSYQPGTDFDRVWVLRGTVVLH